MQHAQKSSIPTLNTCPDLLECSQRQEKLYGACTPLRLTTLLSRQQCLTFALHACGDSSHSDIKPHYDAVKDIVDKCSAGVGTVFECPPTITSNNWDENDWSKRLTAGRRHLFTSLSLDIEFSADMGLRFRDLVSVSLRAPFDTHCFLFHGAPDILIHRTKAVFPAASTSTSERTTEEESEDENTHQRPILKRTDGHAPPQKLGEIIAALHILLTAKVMRKITKGRSLAGTTFSVKGLLVDARVVLYQCAVSALHRKHRKVACGPSELFGKCTYTTRLVFSVTDITYITSIAVSAFPACCMSCV